MEPGAELSDRGRAPGSRASREGDLPVRSQPRLPRRGLPQRRAHRLLRGRRVAVAGRL